MLPSIDIVRKLAEALDITVGFLLGEANNTNILKDTTPDSFTWPNRISAGIFGSISAKANTLCRKFTNHAPFLTRIKTPPVF